MRTWLAYRHPAGEGIPKYCTPLIAREIRMSYEDLDWEEFQKALKLDYKKTDYRKIRGGLAYLEQLANAKRSDW